MQLVCSRFVAARRKLLTIRTGQKQVLQIPLELAGAEEFVNELAKQLNDRSLAEDAVPAKKNEFLQQAQAMKLRQAVILCMVQVQVISCFDTVSLMHVQH